MSSAPSNYVTRLHNLFQATQETHLVTWDESSTGLPHQRTWIVTCKIRGESMGVGSGAQKAAAKEEAAQKTWQMLGN
ncbi:hypothetical protein DL96DRAFT_1702643 [Flagelloscypha sp. PMI_526]|nr:hypothetical protein DL96DRAFT_1702643 [Flagelloscypha sp. PMI_526]